MCRWHCGRVVVLLLLYIPLKVIGYGYLPADDALRHAAKAVSGKSWQEILVLGPAFHFDPNWGWHWLLEKIHLWKNWAPRRWWCFRWCCCFSSATARWWRA